MKLAVFGLIALSSTLAAAQPAPPDPAPQPDPAPYPEPPPQPYPPPQPQPYPPQQYPPQYGYQPAPYYTPMAPVIDGPKSTGTAVGLSLGATFIPPLVASAIAGDNENRNDTLVYGLLIASAVIGPSAGRIYAGDFFTAGLGIRAAGMTAILVGANGDRSTDDAVGYIVLGSLALLGGAIADIAGTGAAVREYNFEHAKRTMMPMVAPTMGPNGTTGAQLGMSGTF